MKRRPGALEMHMAEDVLVSGGLFSINIRDAVSESTDAVTGDKVNITNMALANGLMLMWDYGERINGQSSLIAQDLEAIGRRRQVLTDMLDWTPASFQLPASQQQEGALNLLFDWGVGKAITDKVPTVVVRGVADSPLNWPAQTTMPGRRDLPIGNWDEVRNDVGDFFGGRVFQSADGVYFRVDDGNPSGSQPRTLREIDPDDLILVILPRPPEMVVTEADIAQVRRELEINIESMTQVNQDKQAFLQDLVASLQKWFTFVNSVCDRRKRDADSIVGNFR
jgi:hypothetical protein